MSCLSPTRATFASMLFFVAGLVAQLPPGASPPRSCDAMDAVPVANSPAMTRWKQGQDAILAADRPAAVAPLLAALEFHPASLPVLLDLVRAADGKDARAFWLQHWAAAAVDSKGKCELAAADKRSVASDEIASLQKLASLRAQAAAELAKAMDRYKGGKGALGNGAAARFVATLFVEMCSASPQLLRAHGPAIHASLDTHASDIDAVCKALAQVAQGQFGSSWKPDNPGDQSAAQRQRTELQLRAARVLAGICRQGGFGKDLLGEKPPALQSYQQTAWAALEALKSQLPTPRVWTIAELQALDQRGRDEFTLAHRSWADPGVTMSPSGKYRIETTCGAETLIGTALQIDMHHERLVGHYGVDPFGGRVGNVRIVPEVGDMEIEGMPHWWAGGFQGGDSTVIRFAWNNMPSLAKTLTHELTHRFDGVLRPFVGAWYSEGHADWTGGHFGKMAETQFTESHLDLGACLKTWNEGYADEAKLRSLLEGEIEEYRDNYFAGYSLYTFLRGYRPEQPAKYRAALVALEKNARGGSKDPVGFFEKVVCDGKEGRAADFPAFCVEWRDFLAGIARYLDPENKAREPAWVGRYGPAPTSEGGPMIMDENTWSWARRRAEPYFGQGHAGAAGDLLADAGHPAAAVAAWLWSLSCDGWNAKRADAAANGLSALSKPEQAASLRQLAHARFPLRVAAWPSGAQPMPMLSKLPRTKAFLDALAVACDAIPGSMPISRSSLRAEHERLASLCAMPFVVEAGPSSPLAPMSRSLLGQGFVDDRHVDYDKHRHEGLWHATKDGDLHVGRSKPSEGTGGPERASPSRNVFVRSSEWIPPGAHVFKMRIHLTTAYVDGAIVVGHWRRDRGIRISFSAGDPAFASGRKQDRTEIDRVHVELDGGWERDRQMPKSRSATTVDFGESRPSFELEVRVHGPMLTVRIEGEERLRYTTHDGAPIEGYIGFGGSRGAYRVQSPTVQRLDHAMAGQAIAAAAAVGLDVGASSERAVEELVGMSVRGIPTSTVGTLVLWLPQADDGDSVDRRLPRSLLVLSKLLGETTDFPQTWVLATPKGSKPEEIDAAHKAIAEHRKEPMLQIEHSVVTPLTGSPWLLFVDAAGILRGCNQVGDAELFSVVQRWARMFRAR